MSRSISNIYNNINDKIKLVESGLSTDLILNEIKSDFLELLDNIKVYLISNKDTFYGTFFLNLSFEVDFTTDCIAGIKLDTYPPVFISNPLILCKFSIKEIMFIVCHEIEHIILRHPIEAVKLNPSRDPDTFLIFNYAADASVNDRLLDDKLRFSHRFLSMPTSAVDSRAIKTMLNLKFIDYCESYIYYYKLFNSKKNQKEAKKYISPKDMMGGALKKSSQAENGEDEVDQDPIDEINQNGQPNQGDKQSVSTLSNTDSFSDHDWGNYDDVAEMEANLREYVKQSYEQLGSKQRGELPGYIMSSIKLSLDEPVISWQSILKKYVGTVSAKSKPTRMKLNRRQPNRFDLSGKTNDKVLNITVAIDTSGSMSDKVISYVFTEIFSILKKKQYKMTVLEFDTMIHREYEVKSIHDVKTSVLGRGGTSFECVSEYINKSKKFKDSLLIIFTDGFAETKITMPNVYKILWVVTGKASDLSVKNPYGAVLELDKGDIYG